jgi:2'-5' RNA ligase
MPRLFIGTFVNQPEQDKLAKIAAANKDLEKIWHRRPRWVASEKLHVTWLFLGNVDAHLIAKVRSTLTKVIHERNLGRADEERTFTMEFSKPEVWPSARRPRVLVVANQPVSKAAYTLGRSIRTGLIPFYSEETELEHNLEFKPHVTLMHLDRRHEASPAKGLATSVPPRVEPSALREIELYLPIQLDVTEVCLIESHGGKEYKVLERVSLTG